jgi:hypothetical protein
MGEASTKCSMCGKMEVISDDHNSNQNHIMVEQIDAISYTFDTADCAMMFKRFSSVYGNNFADDNIVLCQSHRNFFQHERS